MKYHNSPVRFDQSVALGPESQRLFFILKQRLSKDTKATLHTCIKLYRVYHYHRDLLINEKINENNDIEK